jgi:hypothetical protein
LINLALKLYFKSVAFSTKLRKTLWVSLEIEIENLTRAESE